MNILRKIKNFLWLNKRSIGFFLVVGALSAAIYFSAFNVFWQHMGLHYKLAVSSAYILSVLFHFTANRYITFKDRNTSVLRQAPKYLLVTFFNYIATILIVSTVVEGWGQSPYLGIIVSIGTTVITGYLFGRFWIFKFQ